MNILRLIFCFTFITSLAVLGSAQSATTSKERISRTEAEVRSFFEAYGEDLRKHRRDAIVNRYDRLGTYFMGNGRKSFDTFDSVKERYLKKWTGPKNFEWKDVSIDVISKTSALVTALFEWTPDSGDVAKCSYTGLFLKGAGEWRIRAEDESCAPRRPADSK